MFTQQPSKNAWCMLLRSTWIWAMLCCLALASCSMPFTSTTTTSTPTNILPTTAVTQPFHQTVKTLDGAFSVTLDVTPNRSGPNVFTVSVLDNHTTQPANNVNVTLYTTMEDMAMGTDSLVLHATANGQFSATSDNLNMRGHWGLAIAIQTPDHVIHKAGVSLVTPL